MDKKLKELLSKITSFWKSLTRKRKTIIIAAFAGVALIVVAIVIALNVTKYTLLYGGLDSDGEAQAYNKIVALGVPVKVKGDSIYVAKDKVDQVRMQLAEEGVPQTNLTYDLYSNNNNWATTDRDRQVYLIFQTQDRLQGAIKTISGVKNAAVTIATGNSDTYVLEEDKEPVKASVKLTLAQGVTLSKRQVQGIVQLVTNSVPGLTSDNVSVIDSDGTPLTGSDTAGDQSDDQLALQEKYSSTVKQKLISMLEDIYGAGNVKVAVNAALDFTQKTTSTVSYLPQQNGMGVPSGVQWESDYSGNGAAGAGGTVGVNGAQPNYPSVSSQSGTGATSHASGSTTYLVGSVQQQITDKGGQVKNLTVAVVLNNKSPEAAGADVNQLKQTIANAAGTTVSNISVDQEPFLGNAATSTASNLKSNGNAMLYLIVGGAAAVLLLATLLLTMLMSKRRKKKEKAIQAKVLTDLKNEMQDQEKKQPPKPVKSIEATIEESEINSVKKEIEDFADKKPELVAQILKNWLKD